MHAEIWRHELRLSLSTHLKQSLKWNSVNCSYFLWMSTTEIAPQSKVVTDLVTDDSRPNMKSFSKTFYSNASSHHQNNSPQGTKVQYQYSFIPWPLSFSGKVLFEWMFCNFVIYFTNMQKTVPKRMKLATASVAPTKVKLLLVNAAHTLKYAVLFYGNSI